MSDFQLSNTIDKEKIFMVNLSEIEGRLDPVMLLYQRKINNYLFKSKPIKNLLLSKPQYGANEAGIDRLNNEESRYIRITDIDENGNLKNELGKTANNIEQQYFLDDDDIIIARSGNTVGKSYIHKSNKVSYPCFFAGYMIRFKFNPQIIYPDYAFIVTQLNFYKEWLNAVRRLAGQPNINAEEYKSFRIPLPPKEIQQQIINKYEAAYTQKQQKEAEAKKLLASIDDYLLKELGITLPEKDNSLKNRIFTANIKDVSDGRFDPFFYLYCVESPKSSKYTEVELKEVASIVKGQSITSSNVVSGKYPVIAGGQTSPYTHNIYNHKGNIITISASGAYSGYVWYHSLPIFASDCSVVKSKNENKCITEFLFNVLKLKQQELYNLQQGSGQPHVYPSDISKIGIPLPDNNKQIEINKHISKIRANVKLLEKEAKDILEKAKQEVEQMILVAK